MYVCTMTVHGSLVPHHLHQTVELRAGDLEVIPERFVALHHQPAHPGVVPLLEGRRRLLRSRDLGHHVPHPPGVLSTV